MRAYRIATSEKSNRKIRNRSHSTWIRVGQAMTDYIGNGRSESHRVIAERHSINESMFRWYLYQYLGINQAPVLIQFDLNTGEAKDSDWVSFMVKEMQ